MAKCLPDDFGEDPGCGPDADAGHRGQDLVKRVGLHEGFDPGGDLVALAPQNQQLFGQPGQHDPGGAGAHNHDGLLPKRGEHCVREANEWWNEPERDPFA